MGIIQKNSQDSLKDFVGFATDYAPLIKLILPVINTVWDKASSSLHEKPRSLGIETTPREITTSKTVRTTKPITPSRFKASKKETGVAQTLDMVTDLTQKIQDKVKETSQQKTLIQAPKASKQIPKTSKQIPKAGDEVGMLIDTAFKSLVQKLQKLNGEEFSTELENIADLILEKKGFSVTLHKLRSKINQYKTHLGHLSEVDINHIVESIEDWKKHLIN
jgi:vacuolar-type H+-ATPase subunit I/STV1